MNALRIVWLLRSKPRGETRLIPFSRLHVHRHLSTCRRLQVFRTLLSNVECHSTYSSRARLSAVPYYWQRTQVYKFFSVCLSRMLCTALFTGKHSLEIPRSVAHGIHSSALKLSAHLAAPQCWLRSAVQAQSGPSVHTTLNEQQLKKTNSYLLIGRC